jgi:hypothetical protein
MVGEFNHLESRVTIISSKPFCTNCFTESLCSVGKSKHSVTVQYFQHVLKLLMTFVLFVNSSCILNIEAVYCLKYVESSKVTVWTSCFMDTVENM